MVLNCVKNVVSVKCSSLDLCGTFYNVFVLL